MSSVALSTLLFTGCDKEDSSLNFNNSNNYHVKQNQPNNKNTSDIVYIPANVFETEFELFAISFFDSYPEGLIEIEFLASSATYALTTNEEGETGSDAAIIICRSSSVQDAERCKSYVDNDKLIAYMGCTAWIVIRDYCCGTAYETHVLCP
tara:strand:+ start:1082 stop:1534 length:453 start_codon:yes stop_codon:yes gene_type:complete